MDADGAVPHAPGHHGMGVLGALRRPAQRTPLRGTAPAQVGHLLKCPFCPFPVEFSAPPVVGSVFFFQLLFGRVCPFCSVARSDAELSSVPPIPMESQNGLGGKVESPPSATPGERTLSTRADCSISHPAWLFQGWGSQSLCGYCCNISVVFPKHLVQGPARRLLHGRDHHSLVAH